METTATKLALIATRAREYPQRRFTALMHHINPDYLVSCFDGLKRKKAPGIDGKTAESYARDEIKQAAVDTVMAMKAGKWRPQPVKRVLIDKPGSDKKRPLGLPAVIDKTVQMAAKNILEAILEADFLDCSHGFRPNRSAHGALKELNHLIMQKKINWIMDADIKSFFDTIGHHWMMECLSQRIADPRFKSLIWKFLKAGAMAEGIYQPTEQGTPQGGIISPILANIYLHYVLDLWFGKVAKKQLAGEAQMIRYADDFVVGFQYKEQAEKFLQLLRERFKQFNLSLAEEKTRIIEFGRFAAENCRKRGAPKPASFNFLGFTHYCATTRDGRFKLGAATSQKSMSRSLGAMNLWLKTTRNRMKLKDLWRVLTAKLQGHYQYYGISGNFERIASFSHWTVRLAYKWLNRRSQKRSFDWLSFRKYLERYPLPLPKLAFQIYHTW